MLRSVGTRIPGLLRRMSVVGHGDCDEGRGAAPGTIPLAQLAAQIFTNVELALEAGFTTVREVGGLDGGVARAVELGLLRGPRVLPAGPLISQTGGHGDHRPQFQILDHPHGPTGVMDHLEAGIECFEHATFLDEETAN